MTRARAVRAAGAGPVIRPGRGSRGASLRLALGLVLGVGLAGCDALPGAMQPAPTVRPPPAPVLAPPAEPPAVSPRSAALTEYYRNLQQDLLVRGLLRTDGGGPDTPFDAWMLARNFEAIAFYNEYSTGRGLTPSRGAPVPLRRWAAPVRFSVHFGDSVPEAQRSADRRVIEGFVARLGRLTGHPAAVSRQGNFHVFVVGEDDRPAAIEAITRMSPQIEPASLSVLRDLPRSIHCIVVAFSDPADPHVYTQAVAIIRAEHPELMRRACVHEELAQGMGLPNDSPDARPSIFNDDEEFALLTSHDEMLLRMLYDPRLRPGMTLDEARPIVRRLAAELIGGDS